MSEQPRTAGNGAPVISLALGPAAAAFGVPSVAASSRDA